MKVRDLARLQGLAQHRQNPPNGTLSKKKGALPDFGWVSVAAAAGYAVGTLLDDLLGSGGENDNLSDDVSDWAAENFPAPDWLQDIF
jgi:hypothetical protein